MLDYHFRTIGSIKDINLLRDHLLIQPLHYPEYEKWVLNVCVPDIESGWKNAVLAFYCGKLIGNIIYRSHKQLPRTCEFKNMRINSSFRGQDIGHFLIRQSEEEAIRSGQFDRIILDIDSGETGIEKFLMFCGYNVFFRTSLYGPRLDVIMGKELAKNKLRVLS
jgi:hypothetical protein